MKWEESERSKKERRKTERQKRERQAKQTDHICARERRLTAGATLPQATNPPRPVLKSKQTETPLTHVNSTSTNNTLQPLSTPPPSSIPHCPRSHSFRNLCHKNPFSTWLQYYNPVSPLERTRTHTQVHALAYSVRTLCKTRPCCSSLLP